MISYLTISFLISINIRRFVRFKGSGHGKMGGKVSNNLVGGAFYRGDSRTHLSDYMFDD